MKSLKNLGFIALLSSVALFTSCEDDKGDPVNPTEKTTYGDFTFEVEHTYDGNSFTYNTEYINGSGEKMKFNNVQYYISNIKLEMMDGTVWSEEESYHLIDNAVSSSMMFQIKDVPTGEYHKISYMIGVDSARNVEGAQEGALSPANNMFWTWQTGYIFIKTEGTSLASSDSTFSYHVGGFAGANAAQVTNIHHMHSHMLNISPNAAPQMHIKADMKMLFDGAQHTISIANLQKVRMPGSDAQMVSHNFAAAFTLDHIHD